MSRREMNTALAAALSAVISGTVAALRAESAAPKQDSQNHPPSNLPRGVAPLITEPIGDIGDSVASMSILTLQPKQVTPPHKHSGPVFAYVLEGRVENQVEPEEAKTYSGGDYWYEPAMHEHRTFTNLSDTEVAKILVFTLIPKRKPVDLRAQ